MFCKLENINVIYGNSWVAIGGTVSFKQEMSISLNHILNTIKLNLRRSLSTLQQGDYRMEPRYDYNRKWTTPSKKTEQTKVPQQRFKLMSYNILSQDLLMKHLYLYMNIRQERLSWRQRMQNLQREILKLDPDILCLQEMQYDHLPVLVQRLTASSGKRLEYVYKKKTGDRTDGCAIIYDSCKFKLLRQHGVEMYDVSVPLLNRENVALLAKFRLKGSSPTKQEEKEPEQAKEVIVATTHLLYNPRRDDVRVAQVGRLLSAIRSFGADNTPVVLTGDFNSLIDSPPIQLLTAETYDAEDSARPSLKMKLIDVDELTASTYQDEWITVDYILRSDNPQLQVQSIYKLPTINSCANVGYIPNHYLGSDHYALGAVFALA